MTEPNIYIASKTKHAGAWRTFRDFDGYPINSTWIDEAGVGESTDLNDLWYRCVREASEADVLIVYCEAGEVLKGAWIEVGAALASGVPVFAVGLEQFTIAKHDRLTHFPDIEAAFAATRTLAKAEASPPSP